MDNFLSQDEFNAISARYTEEETAKWRPPAAIPVDCYTNRTIINTQQWEQLERWIKFLERHQVRSVEDIRRLLSAYEHLDKQCQSLQRHVNLLQVPLKM